MAKQSTPKIDQEIADMLHAAVVMPNGTEHCKEQSALIFERDRESLAVAEMALTNAQQEVKRLTTELEELRRERRKYDDPKSDISTTEETSNDEQTPP